MLKFLVIFLINLRTCCNGQLHKLEIFLYFGQFMDMLFLRLSSCMLIKVNLHSVMAIFEIIYGFYQVFFRISYFFELCLVVSLKQWINRWSFTWLNLNLIKLTYPKYFSGILTTGLPELLCRQQPMAASKGLLNFYRN